jgi:TetR/AcrR family transcriptional regulator, transcriptional repressor for nem operon
MTDRSCTSERSRYHRAVPADVARQVRPAVTPHGLRTRAALLEAGRAVAEEHGLAGISVNAVVAAAGVAKGTFYVHFADRDAFIAALRASFAERVGAAIAAATEHHEAGARRLLAGIDAYLDACLDQRALKALLREAGTGADGADNTFARAVEPNLRAMGWRDAHASARLVVALVAEAAVIELETGRRDPTTRRALRRFVQRD